MLDGLPLFQAHKLMPHLSEKNYFYIQEREQNKCRFLTGYFVLILHFKTLKISTFMRVSKPKLRTNALSQESAFI